MMSRTQMTRVTRVGLARQAPRTVRVAATEDIYVGKGKYVKDDPNKYPSRTELTGGWAGGEQGLREFLGQQGNMKSKSDPSSGPATKLLGGRDIIYTGKGNYVRDDSAKYPSRSPVTGGFAGGERGVSKFVSEGSLEFNPPGEFRPQNSPLIVAFSMILFAIAFSSIWFAIGPE